MNTQASHFLSHFPIFFPFATFCCRSVIFCTVTIQPWCGTMNSKCHLHIARTSGLALMMRGVSGQRYLIISKKSVQAYVNGTFEMFFLRGLRFSQLYCLPNDAASHPRRQESSRYMWLCTSDQTWCSFITGKTDRYVYNTLQLTAVQN